MTDHWSPVSRRPVGSRWLVVGALLTASLVVSGCATDNPALAPTEDARVGVSSTILLLEQVDQGETLPTVATSTASDMLTIVSDAEGSLVRLPVGSAPGSVEALAAVRQAADAVTSANRALADGDDTAPALAQLHSAETSLSAAADRMR